MLGISCFRCCLGAIHEEVILDAQQTARGNQKTDARDD